jgi:ATP-dependent DNA ligase
MFEFCIPTKSDTVPDTPDWLHKVKYDGYRLRLERDGDRVRLITKGGYNWTDRASKAGGRLRPSALPVLRFTTSSYLVGACTGRRASRP